MTRLEVFNLSVFSKSPDTHGQIYLGLLPRRRLLHRIKIIDIRHEGKVVTTGRIQMKKMTLNLRRTRSPKLLNLAMPIHLTDGYNLDSLLCTCPLFRDLRSRGTVIVGLERQPDQVSSKEVVWTIRR